MGILRVATYNIHKGVQGLGLRRRLEIHNLGHAIEQLDADIVCLQEVRRVNRREAQRFHNWPELPQADYLSPEGYEAVYRSNAFTRHGEHGNALLSRWPVLGHQHADLSDHRFEQRGLLHVRVQWRVPVHVIVLHLGLIAASRKRQVERVRDYVCHQVPDDAPLIVAGDFNDWAEQLHGPLQAMGLRTFDALRLPTFPARLPLLHLDRIYARHLRLQSAQVPRGPAWARMSDHLPLVAELSIEAT